MRSHFSVSSTLTLALLISILAVHAASNARGSPNNPSAVASQQKNRLQAPTANTKLVSDSVTNLAAKIANALSNQKSKTEIFSPVSIAGALSLLLLGSGGQTQQELLNVMGLNKGQLTFQEIHLSFGRLFQDLVANDPSLEPLVTWRLNDKCNRYDDEEEEDDDFPPPQSSSDEYPSHQISVANGVFLQQGFKPANRFLNLTHQIYKGTVENLDFERQPSIAATYINEWCSRATNGRIREIVTEDIVQNSRMIVTNALYFKAQWETTFSPFGTRQRPFYANGKLEPPISAESMATSGCFPYYNATNEYGVQIIGLPYEMGKSTMYIILPNGSNRLVLREKLATLSAPQLNWMIDQMVVRKVMVVMPKLSISNRIRLSTVLERLGVRDLFDPTRSNLTAIFKDKQTGTPAETINPGAPINTQTRFGNGEEAKERPSPPNPTIPPVRQNTRPPTVQPTQAQPRPQTNSNPANVVSIQLAAQDCQLIENCQPMSGGKCSCNRIPNKEDNAGCGTRLAAHYYDGANKHCLYGIDASSLLTHICIKPSYQIHLEYKTRAACEQRYECKMLQDKCFCCTSKVQSQLPQTQYLTTTTIGQPLIGNRFGGDEGVTYQTTPLPTQPSYNTDQPKVLCKTVPQLVDSNSCSSYGYRWETWYNVCIDVTRCTQSRIKKRQAPAYPSSFQQQLQPASRQTQPQQIQRSQQFLLSQPELRQLQQQQPIPQQTQQLQLEERQSQRYQFTSQQQQQQQSGQLRPAQQPTQYQQQQPTIGVQQRPQSRLQLQQQQSQQQLQQQLQLTQPQWQFEPVHVNEIVTHVTLDVNEQGTEGGAVTAALIDRIGPGYSFLVDSPFLILIRNDLTHLPLFYGAVYDPRL
uniref:Serpin domain-containing protein n=1 Tax=Anopheles christyi TaxID=43041 RepID=A0A3F2YTS2_9DIPT